MCKIKYRGKIGLNYLTSFGLFLFDQRKFLKAEKLNDRIKSALYKIKYIKDKGQNDNGNSQQTGGKAGIGIESRESDVC